MHPTTTPLQHYPYENENDFCNNSEEISKIMTHHYPFGMNHSQHEHPSPELPFNFFNYNDHQDPIFNPGPNNCYQGQSQNYGDPMGVQYARQAMNEVPDVDETEDEEEQEQKMVPISQVRSRVMKTPPARKYTKKSDQEKKSPEYRQARDRNNDAVRRTRQKNKEIQEAEKKEAEEIKKDFEALKAKYDEQEKAIRLIQRLQQECRANPHLVPKSFYPTFAEMLRFK